MNTIIFTHSFFTLDDKTDLSCSGIIYLRYQLHSWFFFYISMYVAFIIARCYKYASGYFYLFIGLRVNTCSILKILKRIQKRFYKVFRIFLVYDIMLKCLCFLNCLSYCYRKNLHHPGLLNVAKTPDTVNSDL